jgi:transcriptional regulator with XRE-family HTH domain
MELAARIREMRSLAGLGLDDLANEFGISPELYAQYESGTVDIPASFLLFLAGKFGVELTTLLTGEEPRLRRYCLTRKNRGVGVDRRKDYRYQNLAYNFQHKKAEPFLVAVDPDDPGAPIPLNAHPGQEFDYVLEGSMRVQVGASVLELAQGDCLYYDSTVPHGMQATGEQTCKFLAVIFAE